MLAAVGELESGILNSDRDRVIMAVFQTGRRNKVEPIVAVAYAVIE